MKRSPMSRGKGFGLRVYIPPPAAPLRRLERPVAAAAITAPKPVPKEDACRHEGYRRLVASLPCIHCGIHGLSQCAHGNTGKGGGIKTDDRYSFPLCADSLGRRGCHPLFDQGALFSKAARRLIEPAWVADTQRRIHAMGAWPKNLPLWSEE